MRNERLTHYQALEMDFLATEEAIAEARRLSAKLLGSMHDAQAYFRLPPQAVRAEFGAVTASVAALEAVHDHFLQAHEAAVSTRRRALPEVDFGDVGECNPQTTRGGLFSGVARNPQLRVAG